MNFSRAFNSSSQHLQSQGKVLWKELHRICTSSSNGAGGALIMRRQVHQHLQAKYYSSSGLTLTSSPSPSSLASLLSTSSCRTSQGGHHHRHHHYNHFHLWKAVGNGITTSSATLFPRGCDDGVGQRNFSTHGSQAEDPTEGEATLKNTIKKCFPNAANINVQDISGGCGSMYQIYIEAPEFNGLSTVKQHRLVNEALKQEIKSMHGVRIQTAIPKKT